METSKFARWFYTFDDQIILSARLTFFDTLPRTSLNVLCGVLLCSQVAVTLPVSSSNGLQALTEPFQRCFGLVSLNSWLSHLVWMLEFCCQNSPSGEISHVSQTAVITLSLRNSDFMLGIRLVTDAALSFQAPFFF